ncbi:MAG: ribonuclease P protein subunit [Promethearchaeia archaeon]
MKYNPNYLIYHDLIGIHSYARNRFHSHQSQFADIGVVVDDTEHILFTKKNEAIKKYVKNDYLFRFSLPETTWGKSVLLEVDGSQIVGRPENRLRSIRKKRW